MTSRRTLLLLALLAIPLFGGAQCSFSYNSSDDSSDKEDEKDNAGLVVIVGDGTLVDAPVEGVRYESGSLAGITGSNGEFRYEVGNTIRFYIGDIFLGEAVTGQAVITPLDLVPNGAVDTPAVVNIARLLQSLDSKPGDGVITIPPEVRAAAVRSNEVLSPAIEFLDFTDEPAFVNAASQLVAVLTSNYPYTAVLVDAEQARDHLAQTIERLGKGHYLP